MELVSSDGMPIPDEIRADLERKIWKLKIPSRVGGLIANGSEAIRAAKLAKGAGLPARARDGSQYLVGRDNNLVKVEPEKLSKKQRNKLKRGQK